MKTYNIPWSKTDSVLYAICLAALVASVIIAIQQSVLLGIIMALIVVFVTGWLIARTPRSLTLTENELILRHWIGTTHLRRSDIVSIKQFTGSFGIRCFGYGGIPGKLGWFYTKELGLCRAYVSDPNNMLLLHMKTGRPIVLSCEHSHDLIEQIGSCLQNKN